MVAVKRGSLRKAGGARKRRRSASVSTRARYGPKTARFNRSLIKSNAAQISRIRSLMPSPIFTDWQQRNSIQCLDLDPIPPGLTNTFTTNGRALSNFADWENVLRQSSVVQAKSSTRVIRMAMQFRFTLQQSYWAQMSIFIVTLRKDASNREPTGLNPLLEGVDYVSNRLGVQDDPQLSVNPTLNSAIYKVHYARHVTMTQGGFLEPPAQIQNNDVVANGQTTYRKGQINMKMRMNVRNPRSNVPWTEIPIAQLPHYQQYFLLCFISQRGPDNSRPQDLCILDTNLISTCYNSG